MKFKPREIVQWGERVKRSTKPFCDINVESLHSILSKERIKKYINYASFNTKSSVLVEMVEYALSKEVGCQKKTTLENFFVLVEKTIWSFGNSIPGPNKAQRIDLDDASDGFEKPFALEIACEYARKLEAALIALEVNQSSKNWKYLIDIINPSSTVNIAAQTDIIRWSDAWATDAQYKIYIRLDKNETIDARNKGYSLGYGAWVLPEHPKIYKVANKLNHWHMEINRSNGNELIYIVEEMRSKMNCEHCEKWLNKHNKS